jgi:hypothetical protein
MNKENIPKKVFNMAVKQKYPRGKPRSTGQERCHKEREHANKQRK